MGTRSRLGRIYFKSCRCSGLTGQQITSAVPSQLDIPEQVQGLGITSNVGSITPGEFVVGLGGQAVTSSVGSLAPADVVGLTGQAA